MNRQTQECKIKSGDLMYIPNPIHLVKTFPQAQEPTKERLSDVSWDLTLIGRSDNRTEDTVNDINLFSTGIKLSPPKGYHFELIANQNLFKSGYMLATGLTVLQPESCDEVVVPLFKFKEVADLDLPFNGVQIILRESQYAHTMNVTRLEQNSHELTSKRHYSRLSAKEEEDYEPIITHKMSARTRTTGRTTQTKSNIF